MMDRNPFRLPLRRGGTEARTVFVVCLLATIAAATAASHLLEALL